MGAMQSVHSALRSESENKVDRTPAKVWDEDATKRALDELFTLTTQYKSSRAYQQLLHFVARFRSYSPFNSMLIHVQMPGARFVAPPHRWLRDYHRTIKPGARPLVILQPMGPVLFVFDVSDTEGAPLPPEVENPFEVKKPFKVLDGNAGDRLERTIDNCKRDGVSVHAAKLGSQQAGSIQVAKNNSKTVHFRKTMIPVRYELELDQGASKESQFATLVHELAHLYCGHLGTPGDAWWPDRRGLSHPVVEFEAESVAYLVGARAGIDTPSERYLAGYVGKEQQVPPISLECVMKAAGLIEAMGREKMKLRINKPK